MESTSARPTPRVVKVAVEGPQSGDLAFLGKPALQAVQMAVDEFNAKANNNVRVDVSAQDDQGQPQEAIKAAEGVIADVSTLVTIGPMNILACMGAGAIMEKASVGWTSPSCASPKLSQAGWKTMHRLVAPDDAQGSADIEFLAAAPVNAKKLFILTDTSSYATGLADEAAKKASVLGLNTQRDTVPAGTKEFTAVAAKVSAFGPDAVFYASDGPGLPLFIGAANKQGAKWAFMTGDSGHDAATMIDATQGAGEGTYVSDIAATFDAAPGGPEFGRAFKTKYGTSPALFAIQAYDAAHVELSAIQNAANANGAADMKPSDVNAQLAKIKDFDGALGRVTFDSNGNLVHAPIYVYQVAGKDFRFVKGLAS